MMTPRSKAKVNNLNSFGIRASEIDTSRSIESATPEKAALIQINTDSSLNLRIRLLEDAPEANPKLLNEMYVWKDPYG